ncbi:hypothetical protein [Sphingobacterium thalpophilum]|uniref:hypothetical protein n=1 Tax=Sphingobacterium thalpophilum TaxID=259 RepID=UPI0024A69D88|nr:hypothetical protein [Sphingobacterium thalpophilum]
MKIKYIFTFLVLFLMRTGAYAQVDTIPFAAYWAAGDSYDFTITKINQQWQEDRLIRNDSAAFQASFTVLDSLPDGYRIKWAYDIDWSQFSFADSSTSELIKSIAKDMVMNVIYKTDDIGQYVAIENFDDIKNSMLNIFNTLSNHSKKSNKMSAQESEKMNQALYKIFSSEEMVEQMVAKDILLFHTPFGTMYPVKDTLQWKGEMANPFGQTSIPADIKVVVQDVDLDNSFCVISQETTINPADAKAFLLDLLPQLGLQANEMNEITNTSRFDMYDNKHLEYWYNPGVPYFIEAKREGALQLGKEKLKHVEITRIQYND